MKMIGSKIREKVPKVFINTHENNGIITKQEYQCWKISRKKYCVCF